MESVSVDDVIHDIHKIVSKNTTTTPTAPPTKPTTTSKPDDDKAKPAADTADDDDTPVVPEPKKEAPAPAPTGPKPLCRNCTFLECTTIGCNPAAKGSFACVSR